MKNSMPPLYELSHAARPLIYAVCHDQLTLHPPIPVIGRVILGPVICAANSNDIRTWSHCEQWYCFLVNDQRDAQIIFYVFISIYNSLHVSSTQCSSSGETNCTHTASGNSHSMLVAEMCAGWKNLPTCTHLEHQHRMTVTRGCIDTICLS